MSEEIRLFRDKRFDSLSEAMKEFEMMDASCRIVVSNHWCSEGIWLEFPPYSTLAPVDWVKLEKKI